VLYFDHGAPGLIQFPAGDAMHAIEFQATLTSMKHSNRYGKMVVYIEACNSGSMMENITSDMNIYGVTAVPADYPSLGTYCGYDAVINGTSIGSCLGDLFSVYYMKFLQDGDGTHSLNQFFQSVSDDVASYAALHYGHEINQQYGDLTIGDLHVADFFYGDSQADIKLAAPFTSPWVQPKGVYAAPRLAMDHQQWQYTEASAQPTAHGEQHWMQMLKATDDLQALLDQQKNTQLLYWDLVMVAFPDSYDKRYAIWTDTAKPLDAMCELHVHQALMDHCDGNLVATSYALQFHQVVVNLCADDNLHWGKKPELGAAAAAQACSQQPQNGRVIVGGRVVV
jgi:glycosylphosphatidylinositol transamidase (GPIT) subunit GPI8